MFKIHNFPQLFHLKKYFINAAVCLYNLFQKATTEKSLEKSLI